MPENPLDFAPFDWQQYCQLLQSYEFYWNSTLKVAAFFYTLAGAIGAFYITHLEIVNLKWVMLFPALLGLVLLWVFSSFTYSCQKSLQSAFTTLAVKLNLETIKDVRPLTFLLVVNAFGSLLVVIFMLVGFWVTVLPPGEVDQRHKTYHNQRDDRDHPQEQLQPQLIRHHDHH